ncbi:YdbL family protein [Klebsiella pneumoniae]|uniref:YdbL family protein n=1 Tax=Klebsiella pneumoniae TaxID=573 RepID=UPI003AF9D73B
MRKRLLTAALTLALLSAPALALVKQINAARSESYQQLADDNNLPVDEVAKMAGQKLVARAQPGEYVQGLNGQWLRK